MAEKTYPMTIEEKEKLEKELEELRKIIDVELQKKKK